MPVTQPVASQDQFSDIEKQLKSSQQELDTKLAPIQAEKSQAEQGLMGELSKPLPTPPETQPIQQFQPRQISQQEAMNFAGIATAFAALASLKTREPFAAALNAAGDAMKGFQKGNLAQAKIDIDNFNTKTRAAIEENQRLFDQYNAVLNDRKLSVAQKQSMVGAIAAKERDELTLDAVKTGKMIDAYKLLDSRQRAQEATQLHLDTLHQNFQLKMMQLELMREKEGLTGGAKAGSGFGPEDVAKAVGEYRLAPPTGFALKSPYWQNIMQMVTKNYPDYDATKYGAKQAARRTFASGPEARNVTALNTVIGHLGTLDQMATALDNNDVQSVNYIANMLANQMGNPKIANFETARLAVAEETMRVFRQTGASEQEAKRWGDVISQKSSPAQLRGNISTLGTLLESRIHAISRQYERTVESAGNPAAVDPANLEVLKRLQQEGSSGDQGLVYKGYRFPNKQALDKYKAAEGATP